MSTITRGILRSGCRDYTRCRTGRWAAHVGVWIMSDLGFKTLSPENWLEPEPVMSVFKTISLNDSTVSHISRDQWLSRFLKAQLDSAVPLEVRRLFEVARGAATYGYFFYPLYTLAGQQLYRVAETAISIKCKSLGATRREVRTFQDKIS